MVLSLALSSIPAKAGGGAGRAPVQKPNIILILSDDFGYGDAGVYGGGPNRGMPTPNIDRLASESMTFFTIYAQPSCTPGGAAVQTGRIPNRNGMMTVTFQGQPGGLPREGNGRWRPSQNYAAIRPFSPVSGISGSRTTRYPGYDERN
jgi:arylsulfatase